MYKVLRIICCVISALCAALCVFAFIYLGTIWGLIAILGAAAFFALTVLFKKLQEDGEKKKNADAKNNDGNETGTEKTAADGQNGQPAKDEQPTDKN